MTDRIQVEATIALAPPDAFRRFVDGFGEWWPREYTWGQEALEAIGLEPRVGGMCYERGPFGFRCDWGRVLAFEPPGKLVFTWQIGPKREPVPDPAKASAVEVTFSPGADGTTRMRVEHREFERHGAAWEDYRAALASEHGWRRILGRFAGAVNAGDAAP